MILMWNMNFTSMSDPLGYVKQWLWCKRELGKLSNGGLTLRTSQYLWREKLQLKGKVRHKYSVHMCDSHIAALSVYSVNWSQFFLKLYSRGCAGDVMLRYIMERVMGIWIADMWYVQVCGASFFIFILKALRPNLTLTEIYIERQHNHEL